MSIWGQLRKIICASSQLISSETCTWFKCENSNKQFKQFKQAIHFDFETSLGCASLSSKMFENQSFVFYTEMTDQTFRTDGGRKKSALSMRKKIPKIGYHKNYLSITKIIYLVSRF